VLAVLLGTLAGTDRLVLLGDVIELRHGPLRDALREARPVLEQIAGALPSGGEIVLVPGNHDHRLLRPWLERRSGDGTPPALGLETAVDWQAGEPMAEIAGWLAPARIRAAYPGVWLGEKIYATHGHYADRHTTVPMLERLGAGAMARIVREPATGPTQAEDYERVLAPIYAWIDAIAQTGGPELGGSSHGASAQAWRTLGGASGRRRAWRRHGIKLAFPVLVAALNRARIGPLRTDISGGELRRAALRAFDEVIDRLGVRSAHVISGHTHRAGPLPDDDLVEWRAGSGSQLINTGCWVQEPAFLGPRPQTSPYRAGFAAMFEDDSAPGLVNLLDGLIAPDPA
jgi:hypothetical protein